MTVKRTIKDSVFRKRFNNKKRLLELYNALEGTDYGEEAMVEITTLDNAIYHNVKNDIAFTINNELAIFIEHQSTSPKNMALRCLFHLVSYYLGLIQLKDLHGNTIRLPTPKFYVLYNGTAPFPTEWELKLSDVFTGEKKVNSLELGVKIFNINYGASKLLEKSQDLKDYAYFIHLIRQFQGEGYTFQEAVNQAIDQCISKDVMAEFLRKNRQEVLDMNFLEAGLANSFDEYLEDVRMEGLERGKLEATMELAKRFLALGNTVDDVARASDLPLDVVQSLVS